MSDAVGPHLFNPAAPGFNHSGSEEGVGNIGIEGLRGMLGVQTLDGPIVWQSAIVPEQDLVVINADLNRRSAAVILVGHGIQQRLPQGTLRHRIGLDPLHALVGNHRFQVLGQQQVRGLVNLREQAALDLVMIQQVAVGLEITDLDRGTGNEGFGIGMKQQHGRPFQVGSVRQAKLFDQRAIVIFQNLRAKAFAADRPFAKPGDGLRVEIINGNTRQWYGVPMSAGFTETDSV